MALEEVPLVDGEPADPVRLEVVEGHPGPGGDRDRVVRAGSVVQGVVEDERRGPELATLLAHTKLDLTHRLLQTDLPDLPEDDEPEPPPLPTAEITTSCDADYTYWQKYGTRDPRGGGRCDRSVEADHCDPDAF